MDFSTYIKLSNFLSGVDSYDDAKKICSYINNSIGDENEKILIESLLSKEHFPQKSFFTIVSDIEQNNNFEKLSNKYDDQIIIDVLIRLMRYKNNDIADKSISPYKYTKKCPHCNHECNINRGCTYIICGFTGYKFEWGGCKKDWCFKCCKRLCKEWDKNDLSNTENRSHDGMCCKKDALLNNISYEENYCMCINQHVQR